MEAVETVRTWLLQDNTLINNTNISPDRICELLNLKRSFARGPLVTLILANIYMEEVESRALNSFRVIGPDDTWIKIKTQEKQALTEYINSEDSNI